MFQDTRGSRFAVLMWLRYVRLSKCLHFAQNHTKICQSANIKYKLFFAGVEGCASGMELVRIQQSEVHPSQPGQHLDARHTHVQRVCSI